MELRPHFSPCADTGVIVRPFLRLRSILPFILAPYFPSPSISLSLSRSFYLSLVPLLSFSLRPGFPFMTFPGALPFRLPLHPRSLSHGRGAVSIDKHVRPGGLGSSVSFSPRGETQFVDRRRVCTPAAARSQMEA